MNKEIERRIKNHFNYLNTERDALNSIINDCLREDGVGHLVKTMHVEELHEIEVEMEAMTLILEGLRNSNSSSYSYSDVIDLDLLYRKVVLLLCSDSMISNELRGRILSELNSYLKDIKGFPEIDENIFKIRRYGKRYYVVLMIRGISITYVNHMHRSVMGDRSSGNGYNKRGYKLFHDEDELRTFIVHHGEKVYSECEKALNEMESSML